MYIQLLSQIKTIDNSYYIDQKQAQWTINRMKIRK